MSEYILEMNHITKAFSGVKALDDVNLKVKRGEIHALCGENGAGKSTLMNVLSGVYPFGSYEGDIVYNKEVCKFHSIKESEAKGVVIIHQELALSPYLSVAENVFLGNEQTSVKGVINWTETRKKAHEMLEKVDLGDEDVNVPVGSLGVGKQQLIEIAKAMAKKVELLILDEPTAALNDEESKTLLEIMLELKKQGITCIIISHKLNEISYVADSITVIRDGHTIETLEKGKDDFSEDRIIKGMVGRELTNRYPIREGVKNGVVNSNDEIVAAEEYKKKINVKANSINQTVGSLSGGNQQKVVLAKWMLTQPDVLILDEPTRGIDVGAKYEIYCVINDLAKAGKAVIIISSEMPEIIGICDRVYVINEGEIAGELKKDDISQEKIMQSIMAHNRKDDRNE